MARREQAGGGAEPRGRSSGRGGSGRGRRHARGTSRRAARPRRKGTRHAHAQTVARQHPAAGQRPATASAWQAAGASPGGAEPFMTLTPGQQSAQAPLTLMGAEQTALRDALHVWGAARDLAANRVWRRPGGLVRMAGL